MCGTEKPVPSSSVKASSASGRTGRVSNGYILEPVLILFVFILLFSLYAALAVQSRAALLQAGKRSQSDLLIIEEAKYLAGEIVWKRRCSIDSASLDLQKTVAGKNVQFTDRQTYLHASYQEKDRSFHIDVYYDEDGIVKIEYSR